MPSALGNSGLGIILPDLLETRTRSPASVNLHSTSVGFLGDRRSEASQGVRSPSYVPTRKSMTKNTKVTILFLCYPCTGVSYGGSWMAPLNFQHIQPTIPFG